MAEQKQHIIQAKCIDHCMDSMNCVQYFPGDLCEFNMTTGRVSRCDGVFAFTRQLFWLKTQRGKWTFEFDRANSSDSQLRIFFCRECGQPFDNLNEIGTHSREFHNKNKVAAPKVEAEPESEEKIVVERRGAKKGRTFTCHDCGESLPNLYATRKHKKVCPSKAAPVVVPETAAMAQQA